jgi:hypothetical protein
MAAVSLDRGGTGRRPVGYRPSGHCAPAPTPVHHNLHGHRPRHRSRCDLASDFACDLLQCVPDSVSDYGPPTAVRHVVQHKSYVRAPHTLLTGCITSSPLVAGTRGRGNLFRSP